MEREEIFQRNAAILHDTFDIAPERITPQAMLGPDLDIDSIDAVDLIVQLKPMLGGNLRPEAFKAVRTVQDMVDTTYAMLHADSTAS